MSFLLYGASGYTGKLTAEYAVSKGLRPTLAGRSEEKTKALAEKLGLDYVIFTLDDVQEIAKHLEKFPVVLHCAGPFSQTARQMVEACLISGTHYLDITGEIAILEWVKQKHVEALEKGILLMCGVGFDLVPTDCVANKLKEQLPDATHLEIAFDMVGGSISHGTMSTMVNNLGNTSYTRENGKLIPKALGHIGKWINFGAYKKYCISIPWGDLFSAYESTKIPNISTLTSASKFTWMALKLQFIFNPMLRSKWFKTLFQNYVDRKITGPTADQNKNGKSMVYGKVWNEKGETKEAWLEGPESYQLTAQTSILIVQKILSSPPSSGYQTPASLYGSGLILETEGTKYL